MRAIFVAGAMALALAGCNSAQPGRGELFMSGAEVDAKDDALCRSYGAKPGTDVYVQCRMNAGNRRQAFKAAILNDTTCTSNRIGSTVVTNCH